MPTLGASPDCKCGRGHNAFGWFWSGAMQRIHDEHEVVDEVLQVPEEPPAVVHSLGALFDARMRSKTKRVLYQRKPRDK